MANTRYGKLERGTSQSIPNDTWTKIEWGIALSDEILAPFYDSSEPTKINLDLPFRNIKISANIAWAANNTNSKRGVRIILHSPSLSLEQEIGRIVERSIESTTGDSNKQLLEIFENLPTSTGAIWATIEVYQNTGASLDVVPSNGGTFARVFQQS